MIGLRAKRITMVIFLGGIILLSACSITPASPLVDASAPSPTTPVISSPSLTMTPFPITTLTASLTPSLAHTVTPEQTLSATSTTTPYIWESLPPGQYIVYSSLVEDNTNQSIIVLNIVSVDGKTIGTIVRLDNAGYYPYIKLSPDRRYIAYINNVTPVGTHILDLETNLTTSVTKLSSCHNLSWSPDSTRLVAACGDIYVLSIANRALVRIIQRAPDQAGYFATAWSPDGKWIAYHQLYDNLWDRDAGGGLYLLDTSCLVDISTCPAKTRFLGKIRTNHMYHLTWSPDSRYLAAFISPGTLGFWNIEANTFHDMTVPDWEASALVEWGFLAWSPDGEWIVYSQPDTSEPPIYDDIFIINADGGQPKLFLYTPEIKTVLGWLTIAWPFRIGDIYTITEAGADLNLRVDPSLSGAVLTQLQPGDTVTILDGPIEADGYTWWKMSSEDGTEGWAVNIPEWYEPSNH